MKPFNPDKHTRVEGVEELRGLGALGFRVLGGFRVYLEVNGTYSPTTPALFTVLLSILGHFRGEYVG